jgi:hypothetical protein
LILIVITKTTVQVGYYRFLGDRFAVPGAPVVPSLPSLVRLAKA